VTAWLREDTEAVACCVCHREGRPLYDLDPFGVVRCPRCSLVFVSPRLRPEALQKLYEQPAYHEGVYGEDGRFSPAMMLQRRWTRGRLALAEEELGRPVSGARLLEVGAGHGLFLAAARERGYDVVGVELSETSAAHARESLGLTVHSTQLEDAPLAGRFDVICAWDTIEHVPDPDVILTEIHRLLKPGGRLFLTTGDLGSFNARIRGSRWRQIHPPTHVNYFSRATMRTLLSRLGFRTVGIETTAYYHSMYNVLATLALRGGASGRLSAAILAAGGTRVARRVGFWIDLGDIMFVVAERPC
jgi:2-polyprenyl-3-methyl-5-hydroxy-6-metoxy-1,4-benzoquinol methylase